MARDSESLTATSSPPPMLEKNDSHDEHNTETKTDATVPWFPSPMDGWNAQAQCFSPRHEASTIELFFDLWFVANLATFTTYHAITNRYNFWSYIAFFVILWSSWFHVVCFDSRFAFDSIWERACKTVHFCAFATFALVGYKFSPVAASDQAATPQWIYRTLCFALLLGRAWLALQYFVAAAMCSAKKHRDLRLTLPLALNALLFLAVAAIFGGLFAGFSVNNPNRTGLLIGLYVTLLVEFLGTLTISMTWRKLSFKATHIGERLGLLGLIIIGEGVIGITKTVTRTMGKNGPTIESSAQIFCIILILLFMWILYFDTVPRYRFRTIPQQLWMALHLPFHLAILGVVEGSQHLAQARYIYSSTTRMVNNVWYACVGQHLDGQSLASNLTSNIEYFKINESARGTIALDYVYKQINLLGNSTDVCSPANTSNITSELAGIPFTFDEFMYRASGAMVQALEIDIPLEGERERFTTNLAMNSWVVVYTYFWSAIILLLVCYTITSVLGGACKQDWRHMGISAIPSFLSRTCMIVLAIVMLVLGARDEMFIQRYIASSWILPTVVLALWTICLSDRVTKMWRFKREKGKRYESVATEQEQGGQDGIRRRRTNAYGYPSHC